MNPATPEKTRANKTNKPTKRADAKNRVIPFEFHDPEAQVVCIAGTFNDWRPDVTPMIPMENGRRARKLSLPPGTCEYRLVVDGEWLSDPRAAEYVPAPCGGFNSVLKV